MISHLVLAQYDCIFAEGKDYLGECPDYDTKQSNGKALVMQNVECRIPLYCHCSKVHSDPEW